MTSAEGYIRNLDERAERELAPVESLMTGADGVRIDPIANSGIAGIAEEPEPLRRPVPPPKPYPIAELGMILSPACEAIRRVVQAPDAVCGASLLAAAALAVQGLANVEIDGRIYPLTLWMLTVAESGERKTGVDAESTRAARVYEKSMMHAYAEARHEHEAQQEEWDARRDKAKTDAKKHGGDGLAEALRNIGPAPEAPLRPTLIAADFTAEGLSKMLAAGRPSIGVFTDEAALVFGGHSMTKESVTRTVGTLCKLWDNGTLDRVRAGDGAIKLYGRRLSMHLMAQPVIAERAMSDELLSGQGFNARCLIAWPDSTAGTRVYHEESLRDDPAMVAFNDRCASLLHRPLALTDGERNELNPPSLVLTREAKAAWLVLYRAVESAMAPNGRYAIAKIWASKTPEQCLRIAGVLTLMESPDATTIDAATIERASEIALWHLNEAARLVGTAQISPEIRDAEALLNWCHASRRAHVYSTVALQLGPPRVRERGRFLLAMDVLARAGWAYKIDGGMLLDGKHRKNAWQIIQNEGS